MWLECCHGGPIGALQAQPLLPQAIWCAQNVVSIARTGCRFGGSAGMRFGRTGGDAGDRPNLFTEWRSRWHVSVECTQPLLGICGSTRSSDAHMHGPVPRSDCTQRTRTGTRPPTRTIARSSPYRHHASTARSQPVGDARSRGPDTLHERCTKPRPRRIFSPKYR